MYCLFNNFLINKNFKYFLSNIFVKSKINLSVYYNYNFGYSFFYKCLSKNKNLFYFFKYNGYYYYSFSKLNYILFVNFFKSLNNLLYNNKNILFIDSNYKTITPLLNFMYNTKNISIEKTFFFLNKKNFTRQNYIYLYKIFLLKYNVKAIIVLDFNYFKFFFLNFLKLNTIIFSVLDQSSQNLYCDFFFFSVFKNLNLMKIIVYNKITSIFFYYYNIRIQNLKIFFLKKTKKLV